MSDDSSRPSKPESDEASPSSEPVPNAGRDEVVDLDATLDPYATLQFDPNEGRMLERPRGDGIDDGTIVPQTDDASSPLRVGEVAPLSRGPLESGTRPDRFLKGKAHARGGLGEVFVALDAELNRQVALKQIQQQFATDEFSRRRFMFEAEITGRLEHPGIVPVYGMGLDARGEPYYAMRFIQGMSLERAIQDAHGKGGPTQRLWSGAAESYLDLRRLLSRFMDVCQTIGFAHSRNVIHRDIKPDNIMLGSYGETLVVDWGLARKLDPKTPSKSRKPGNSSQRMIEGTPAFMSPEQAVGDLDGITTASDVYSLGATLYCILTGHPAVMTTRHDGRRRSVHEVLEIVRKGDVPSPRQIDPSIPKSLEAICMRAMSHRPSERYQTAQQLAAEVERWMADEPVDAYRESWLQRSRRWIKRHQAMAASLLAIVMVSAMGLMIFSIVLRGKNTQLANLADSLSTKNQQLDQRSQELERSNQDLRVARNRADRKAAIATAVTEFLNKDVLAQASPLAQPEPDLKVRTVFSRAADALDVRFDTEPAVKAELLHTVGIAFRYLDQLDDAESSLREALSLQSDLPNADELAVRRTKLELASVLLARGKQSDVPDLLRSDFDRLSDSDESRPSADATEERLLLLTVLSEYYSVGERWDLAERFQLELIDLCKRMLGENHWATLEAQTSHANILIETGRFDAALRLAREVSQRSRQHLGPNHMITLGAELALAQRLYYSQQTDEAFEIYKRVLESCQRTLGEEHAYTLYVRNDLAMLQSGSGNSAGALETLQKVHELTLDKYGPNHRENLVGALNLASVMLDMDSGDEAVALIRDVMSRSRQSLGDDHSVTGYARTCLAEYHFREGELDEAEALLRENIDQDFRERIDGRIDQLTPLLMDGYLLAIEIAIERANYSEAIDRSRDILEEFSRRGMMSSASASFVFHQLAIARVANDDADSALQMLGEWADPTTLGQRQQLRFRLGVVDALLQAERFDQADTELKPVVGLLKDLRIESEEDCFLLAWAADVFSYADRMGRSLDLYQRAIAGMSERWEPTHATLVATMEDYAWQLELDDQVDEAASVMQNVVDRRAESIGANVSLTQSSIAYFAELLHESGRSSEAAKQFDRIESIDRLTDLDDEAQTNLLLTMAETYREVDRFSESVTHYLSAYDRLSFALGKYHEETLYAQHQLAYTFDKAGQPDEAMATYRQVIDGRRTTLGPVHQHTLLSTGNLLLVLLA
ncbi:MAG: serine/threonine-protein kinase [Planctomycetota bacterium]